jgi:hypothetical protein
MAIQFGLGLWTIRHPIRALECPGVWASYRQSVVRGLWLIGFVAGSAWQYRRNSKAMSKLHDDLKFRIAALSDLARLTVAAATETEQSFADVYRQLDEAEQMLKQFLVDNAAKGSSSGGQERPQRASFAEPDQEQEQAREQEQDREIEQARSVYRARQTAKEQGWKP